MVGMNVEKEGSVVVIGKASGKIILMGEHAVVYGQPAIAIPFSAVEIVAQVRRKGDALSVSCAFYEGLVHQMPKVWESLKHAIRFSLYRIGAPSDPAIHIDIRSTIPAERGMGSSAAVAVAVARSLFTFYQKELTNQELWEIVQSSEKIAHGNPSGIDALAISRQSPIYFVKEQTIEPISIRLDAYLVVADTGVTGNTYQAIDDVATLVAEDTCAATWIEKLGQLTQASREMLETGQVEAFGELMTQAHTYLQKLGVSLDALDNYISLSREKGALGAKLTGGGRGGCMIALAADKETAQRIATALMDTGAHQTWIQFLGE